MTSCMDVYKAKIQSNGSLEKLKCKILIRRDFQNKDMIGYTWSSTELMKNMKYFLADSAKYKGIVHELYFVGAFLQHNIKHRFLRIWTVDMQNTSHNMPNILEDY